MSKADPGINHSAPESLQASGSESCVENNVWNPEAQGEMEGFRSFLKTTRRNDSAPESMQASGSEELKGMSVTTNKTWRQIVNVISILLYKKKRKTK